MEVKRSPETSEAGQACGLGRRRALVSMLCDHGHIGVLSYGLRMLTPIRTAVEEGEGHMSEVARTAASSQCMFFG